MSDPGNGDDSHDDSSSINDAEEEDEQLNEEEKNNEGCDMKLKLLRKNSLSVIHMRK